VIQEAGLDGFWIHRLLLANGIESHVVDAASIAVDRRHRRAKTADAEGGNPPARMAERFASRLSAPHPGRRRLDRWGLSFGNQHPPGAAGACRGVRGAPVGKDVVSRTWRKVKGD